MFRGPKGMLSGIEIADAVRREREYRSLIAQTLVGPHGDSLDGDGHLSWAQRARLWWLQRQPRIHIDDFDPTPSDQGGRLNPNSYNLRLHPDMLVYDLIDGVQLKSNGAVPYLDMRKPNPTKKVVIPAEGYLLKPGVGYLARTVENTNAFNCVPCLNGRSSIGRLFINVHVTAGFGDVGFCGTWTLEIFVLHPVMVYPNVEICQIAYDSISRRHRPYQSRKYAGQQDATASRLYMDFQHAGPDRQHPATVPA